MTVKEAVQQHLASFSMSWADCEAFLEVTIPRMQRSFQDVYQEIVEERANSVDAEAVEKLKKLAHEAKRTVECWDKDVEQYSTEWWEGFIKGVEGVALEWTIARLNTLEATLEKFHQEIHRLSSPANEQGQVEE